MEAFADCCQSQTIFGVHRCNETRVHVFDCSLASFGPHLGQSAYVLEPECALAGPLSIAAHKAFGLFANGFRYLQHGVSRMVSAGVLAASLEVLAIYLKVW